MNKKELLKVAKPILFNTAMVKVILEGRKTVTRRLIKPQPDARHNCFLGFVTDEIPDNKRKGQAGFGIDEYGGSVQYAKPPCKVGNILYVRETWCRGMIDSGEYPDGRSEWFISQCEGEDDLILKAHAIHEGIDIEDVIWKPSIHMPKEAARIFLKVKDVRVERLQDITEKEAWKEGILSECAKCNSFNSLECQDCANEHEAYYDFMNLWDSTIKKDHLKYYGCEANPYVWVIEFERIEVE